MTHLSQAEYVVSRSKRQQGPKGSRLLQKAVSTIGQFAWQIALSALCAIAAFYVVYLLVLYFAP